MATTVAEVMISDPETINLDRPITEAAGRMRSADVGEIVVLDGDRVCGVVTDLDLVMWILVERGSGTVRVGDVCPAGLAVVSPGTLAEHAVELMREQELRRLPVLDGERLVGVVSLTGLTRQAARVLATGRYELRGP